MSDNMSSIDSAIACVDAMVEGIEIAELASVESDCTRNPIKKFLIARKMKKRLLKISKRAKKAVRG